MVRLLNRSRTMSKILRAGMAALGIAVLSMFAPVLVQAQQISAVAIDEDDIGGVVRRGRRLASG